MSRAARRQVVRVASLVGVGAITLSACASTGTVAQWAAASGFLGSSGQLSTVSQDLKGVANGIASHELRQLHTVCEGLSADAATAYGELPTPDAALTRDLNTAYTDFATAARDCYDASSFTAGRLRRAQAGLAAGKAALARAESRLRVLRVG